MAKHQRALAAMRKKVQAELRAEHDRVVAETKQQHRKLEDKMKAELQRLERQKEHLQQSARILSKTLRDREEEYQRLTQECTGRVLRAQESELQAKEAAKRMEGINQTLMEKLADLQQQGLDLRQKVAELRGADQLYQECRLQATRSTEHSQQEMSRLQQENDALKQQLSAASKDAQRLTALLAERDEQARMLQRKLQKSQRLLAAATPPEAKWMAPPDRAPVAEVAAGVAAPFPVDARPVSTPEHTAVPSSTHIRTATPLPVPYWHAPLVVVQTGWQPTATPEVPPSAADPDARVAVELLRLQRERESLLRTGVYSDDDPVLRELVHQMDVLRRVVGDSQRT
eukprot:GGOE01000698.1.p1 GENE.GGOE01000698.1~~GGOE01000698.1.p1  ORF type:complete len:394 (+),score=133.50 GGOE01000698.1:154-1182(+)